MKKSFFLLFIFLLAVQLKATTIAFLDSVLKVLDKTNSIDEKLNCLYTLSYEYGLIEPRKGIRYGYQCLYLAEKNNNLFYQLNGFNGIANSYETLANFDSAQYFHRKSFEIARILKRPAHMALTLFNVALCYKQQGNYENALKEYLAAYKLLEKEPSYNPRIHFYLGEIYMRLNDFEKADYQSRMGIKKCKEFNHDYIIYNMYLNLAKCHMHYDKIDSAVIILNYAFEGLQKHTDVVSLSLCLNTLGEVYVKKGEFEKAFAYFSNELKLHKKTQNKNGLYLAYINLAHSLAHLRKKDVKIIRDYLKSGEDNKSYRTNRDIILESNFKIAETYELINEPKKALQYYKCYFESKDSLLNIDKLGQIQGLQAKYENEKKEQQIITLKQNNLIKTLEIDSQKNKIKKRNFFIIFGLLFFALTGLIIFIFIKKQKQKQALEKELTVKETEEKERLRLAKDIHDDLGAGLSKISFLSEISNQHKNLTDNLKENLNVITETSKNLIVNMRDIIWVLDSENVTLADLVARIREYSSEYLEDVSIELKFHNSFDFPNKPISKESYRGLLMIVKETLNNIVKHSKANFVEINVSFENDFLFLSVKDNGIGINKENTSGNGLRNMKIRAESIDGKFSMESVAGSGTLITISIPFKTNSLA